MGSLYQNDKEIKPSNQIIRVSRRDQFVYNEVTPCEQWSSYSCMPKAEIDEDNKNTQKHTASKKKIKWMLEKRNCPIRGVCPTENVLYYAKISCDDEKYKPELYKRIFKTTFKKR